MNDEFGELFQGLVAAERALAPGGALAVVTFHSIEDRMVKRFFQARAGSTGAANRFAPAGTPERARFEILTRKAVGPTRRSLPATPARVRPGFGGRAAPMRPRASPIPPGSACRS